MAKGHRLLIFVSDKLRSSEFLDLRSEETDVLIMGDGQLTVEKEPETTDPWETELKEIVIKKIVSLENWEGAQVRIAGHLRSCFGADAQLDWERDQRFLEKEENLKRSLGTNLDVQIWGFHHEEGWSPIWRTVIQIIKVIEAKEETVKTGFLEALENVFQTGSLISYEDANREGTKRVWEKLSVAKHEIVGLFDPLRIRLETARDISAEDPGRAGEIRVEVQGSIDLKLKKARRLLEDLGADITCEEAAEWFRQISARLDAPPTLSAFAEWLNQLDDCLNKLRNAVTK